MVTSGREKYRLFGTVLCSRCPGLALAGPGSDLRVARRHPQGRLYRGVLRRGTPWRSRSRLCSAGSCVVSLTGSSYRPGAGTGTDSCRLSAACLLVFLAIWSLPLLGSSPAAGVPPLALVREAGRHPHDPEQGVGRRVLQHLAREAQGTPWVTCGTPQAHPSHTPSSRVGSLMLF